MANPIVSQLQRNGSQRWVRLAVGVLIGAIALGWAVHGLERVTIFHSLGAVSPAWVGLAVAGVMAVALTKAARWGALYPASGLRPPFWELFSVLVAGQMVNLVIPIRLGELVRLGLMKQAGQPGATTLSTILLEKALDLVTVALVAVSLVALAAAPDWLRESAGTLLPIGLTLIVGLLLVWWRRESLERGLARLLRSVNWWPGPWPGWLAATFHTMLAALRTLTDWRSMTVVLFWTMIIWLLSLLTMVALLAAFGLHLPLTAAVILMLAVSSSNMAPSPPALVGLMQGLAVLVLGQYGVAQATALDIGIVLNVIIVLPPILLGCWALWARTGSVAAWLRKGGLAE